ncbi:MAG: alpha/beta fold hydrolase [Parvularcula sp.]|nr:alpha/beta fold hydrolase [Parvularcula sp.]
MEWAKTDVMIRSFTATGLSALLLSVSVQAEELSIGRLYASPSLSGQAPRAVAYAPDGSLVTLLRPRVEDASRFDLWAFDTQTGEASMLVDSMRLEPDDFELSEEEKALRERKRIAGSRGIVDYSWDEVGESIVVPLSGDLFLVDAESQEVRRLTETEGFEYDAKVSPGGRYVSFLRDGALFAIDLESGKEERLSPKPSEGVSYGTAEFVAQEEMSRYTGNWWSPDDSTIVYTRTDETGVDIIPRFDIAAGDVTIIEQRYPRAGRPNAVVDLFVRRLDKRRPVKVEWGASPDSYLARVHFAGPDRLFIETVNRDQTELTLSRVDLSSGKTTEIHRETQDNWINLSEDFNELDEGFVWTTEETGYRHIYRFTDEGEKTQLTSGDWQVLKVHEVDEDEGLVYFSAYKDTPLEDHLYKVPLGGGEIERVTALGSDWMITMAPDAKSFVGKSSNVTTPPQTGLYRADGERIAWIEENALGDDHPYAPYLDAHAAPEFGTIEAEDGQLMYYSLVKPHDFDPSKEYPAIVEVYGGPGVKRVANAWGRGLLDDQLAQQKGYVVFRLDNRGSTGRGKRFEDVIYRDMSRAEVADQVRGTRWLGSQDFVDEDRIGVNGWSYGGYMALHLALRAPEGMYAAAVSGAPVTDWRFYDTFYTERYMGTPEDNPEGYETASVFPYLEDLSTPLLMVHGMADDNVIFKNSTEVFARLQDAAAPFEMMTYPGQRHGIRQGRLGEHRVETTYRFLDRYLKPEE